jgi:hypothetical protein
MMVSLAPSGRHTAFVAALTLGFGDALPLPFEHGLPLGLSRGTDDSQHQATGRRARVERLPAGRLDVS